VARQAVRQHNVGIHRIGRYPVHDGELLLAQDSSKVAPAERCFRTAIEVARTQYPSCESCVLPTTLSRMLMQEGKRNEARAMLGDGDLNNWFTEGFATTDLKDAKALLDELNH
jgi:hypothetical protein